MPTKHSVRVDKRNCVGCTNCIKDCPTEAIRVQKGKARIMDERCIDCGKCLLACPHNAMLAITTPLTALGEFKYNIVVPSGALYSQFKGLKDIEQVFKGLFAMGFDYIYEEAKGFEILAEALRGEINSGKVRLPLITTLCPVIPRLVCALFPNLIENLSSIISPAEIAARIAKEEFCAMTDVPGEEVGVYYISPCAARMTNISNPTGISNSVINGVFSIRDIYARMIKTINTPGELPELKFRASSYGVSCVSAGGLSAAVATKKYLAVDGIDNVIRCLDEIENNSFSDLVLLEALCCQCGCVGGPITFENPFVARNRVRVLANSIARDDLSQNEHIQKYVNDERIRYDSPFKPRPVMRMDDDLAEASRKMRMLESIAASLPGLDCGSCGSPSCRTLAEDIVRGNAVELDCIFKLRDKVRDLAEEMVDLAKAKKRG